MRKLPLLGGHKGKWVFVAKRWEEMRKVRLIMYPISNKTRGVSA